MSPHVPQRTGSSRVSTASARTATGAPARGSALRRLARAAAAALHREGFAGPPNCVEHLEERIVFADVTAPSVMLVSAPATNSAGQAFSVTVRFFDDVAINPASITSDNIFDFGNAGLQYGTLSASTQNTDGSYNATYAFPAPPIAGIYELDSSAVFQVADTSGNLVPSIIIGSFTQLAGTGGTGGLDTIAPNATLTGTPLRSNGNASYDFDVTYTDDTAIDATTIDNSDIRVTGTGGYTQLATLTGTTTGGTGTTSASIVAHYRVPAPTTTNTLTVSMVASQVKDTSNNFVPAGLLGAFTGLPQSFGAGGGGGGAGGGTTHIPPDLSATLPDVIPSRAVIGGTVNLRVRVSNLGGTTARKAEVGVYATTNQVVGSADTLLTSVVVDKLAGGSSKIIRVKVPIGDLTPGTYFLGALIDPDSKIGDTNRLNNGGASSSTIQIDAPFVDLSTAFVGTLPDSALGGTPGTAKLRIGNGGNVTFDRAATVSLYASADNVLDAADTLIASGDVHVKVDPNDTTDTRVRYTYPSSLLDGNYFLIAKADPGSVVADPNAANNIAATAATIHIIRPIVDLTPTSVIIASKGGVVALTSGTDRVDVLLRNLGKVPTSGPLTISLSAVPVAQTTTSIPLTTQTFDTTVKLDRLQRYGLTFTLPPSLASGAYLLKATVDPDNRYAESIETNNDVFSVAPIQVIQTA